MDVYIPQADAALGETQHLKLNELNERQYEAVTAPPQNMLVLAGAGSGKTKVLISRIGYLIQAHRVSSFSIMAVTFTNKAAAEMRHRLEGVLGQGALGSQYSSHGMWIGTFHGLAHRFLRTHYREAKLPESFQVLDSDDQHRLIRRVMKSLNLDESAIHRSKSCGTSMAKKTKDYALNISTPLTLPNKSCCKFTIPTKRLVTAQG